jgi:hypothetical protein
MGEAYLEFSHETDGQLELYTLFRLADPRVAAIEQHLLVCEACRKRLDDVEMFATAMRQAIADEPEVQTRTTWFAWLRFRGQWQPALAWAGGLAALALAAVLYPHSGRDAAPLASLQLTAIRGDIQTAATARETDITLADAPALPGLRAEVVDATGEAIWSGRFGNGHRIELMKQLAPGYCFVRLYDSAGKLLHEYGFRVRSVH